MRVRVWVRITDCGDGSSIARLFPTEEAAREGLDDDNFAKGAEIPCDIDYSFIETDDFKGGG